MKERKGGCTATIGQYFSIIWHYVNGISNHSEMLKCVHTYVECNLTEIRLVVTAHNQPIWNLNAQYFVRHLFVFFFQFSSKFLLFFCHLNKLMLFARLHHLNVTCQPFKVHIQAFFVDIRKTEVQLFSCCSFVFGTMSVWCSNKQ